MTSNLVRLNPTPPEPTLENPHAQLEWLCERFVRRYENEHSKASVRNVVLAYKHFLKEEGGYDERLRKDPRFYLSVHWDQFFLYNAGRYWRSRGNASHTIYKRLLYLRHLFDYAAGEQFTATKFVLSPSIAYPSRETSLRGAYEDAELASIWKIVEPAVEWARNIVAGYKPTGIGTNPLKKLDLKKTVVQEPSQLTDSSTAWQWENFVWYFENILNCQPFLSTLATRAKHKQFYKAANNRYSSLEAVWRRLGVAPLIGTDLIFPLAMKLCWETGLNPESIVRLKRDCFQPSHPLTNLPSLHYYKERSTGEKELHLTFLDSPDRDEIPLSRKQSLVVQRTVELILKLTGPLVEKAKGEDKDLLLLYEIKMGGQPAGTVSAICMKNVSQWSRRLLRRLQNGGGELLPLYLNFARFRSTKITQMAREGRDICDIQAVAGHASVTTTAKYMNERQIAPVARRQVSKALQTIHENRVEFERNPKPYASGSARHQDGVIYKGILCDCKNVFDPPQSVRRLPTYKEGQACTYHNMCLMCPNVVITKSHLPLLLSHKMEIKAALADHNLRDAPNSDLYEKTMALIEGVLLEFDGEDIAWALEMAECADFYLDSVTYRGVEDGN